MSLTFDQNGVQTNTFAEIFQRLDGEYKVIYGADIDTDQESADGQRIGIETALRFDIESVISGLYSGLDPDLNNGDMQQVIGKLAGVYLLAASRSQWDLQVELDRTTTLPSGYTITDVNNQEWFLDSDVPVLIGVNNITFLSSLWGDILGVQLGSEFTQATPELGVLSITASADATTGGEEETEEEFRVRRKNSVENPSQSTIGAIYAKLAQLPGVTDLQVYDNSSNTADVITGSSNPRALNSTDPVSIGAHTMWAVIEGGSLDDIGEVIAKQRLGGTKGAIEVTYTDELIKPNGDSVFIINEHKIDRPDYIDLHVRLTATQKVSGSAIDDDAIKDMLVTFGVEIGIPIQAAEVYHAAFIDNYNYIVSDLELSDDGIVWTDQEISPGVGGKFSLDIANITVTVVNI